MDSVDLQQPLVDQADASPCVRSMTFNGRPYSGLRISGARRSLKTFWAAVSAFYLLVGGIGFIAARVAEVEDRTFGGVWLCVGVLVIVGERCEWLRRRNADIVVGRWFIACSQRPRSFAIVEVVEVSRVLTNVDITLRDGTHERFFRGRQVDVAEFVVGWMKERIWMDSMV